MTFGQFIESAFLAFLGGTFALVAWFSRAVVVELRDMKRSISEMNVTLAVVINNQGHQKVEIDDIKQRVVRLESGRN